LRRLHHIDRRNGVQSCTTPLWRRKITACRPSKASPTTAPRNSCKRSPGEQAAQCGYCINGIIMTVAAMLAPDPPADRDQIVATLDERHLCRCGRRSASCARSIAPSPSAGRRT